MNKIMNNPLKTRNDVIEALNELLEPFDDKFDDELSGIELIATGVGYGGKTASIETMLRLLWGLVPLEVNQINHPQSKRVLKGIINGTNPDHEQYWGELTDFDQLIVEMSAIGYMLLLSPEVFWNPLNEKEKTNLVQYLHKVNKVEAHDCNWLFFAVLVNLGLKNVGRSYDQDVITKNLNRIEDYYIGDGWYKDGPDAHVDYYVAFAIHFYSLIYSIAMEQEDPKRCKLYKGRAKLFSDKFVYWFSKEGQGIPYGRSMTYRFSQVAFFTVYILAEVDSKDIGWMKGVILRHLRYWFKQPIFNGDGTLSVGYTYPNLHMSENYNSPGSPYWSLKSFLIVALPENHLFWTTPEAPFPDLKEIYNDFKTEQSIIRNGEHVVMFPNGYKHMDDHTHTAAKYEKFAYSTHFGFSVSRSNVSLSEGAFDSMLALSEDGEYYRVKRKVIEKEYHDEYIYMKWQPWKDVIVNTWIIPGLPWHIRIHKIMSARDLKLTDGGFALESIPKGKLLALPNEYECYLESNEKSVGVVDLLNDGIIERVQANSNTNILYPNTIIPSITHHKKPGEHLLIHGFYGALNENVESYNESAVYYDENNHKFHLNGKIVKINIE